MKKLMMGMACGALATIDRELKRIREKPVSAADVKSVAKDCRLRNFRLGSLRRFPNDPI